MFSKFELVRRANQWATTRGMVFTAAQLNEWMKQDLVWPPRRAPNQGKRPVYVYGAAQYRRVLQLIRLRREGYEDTDAVWVQLFLRGYVPPSSRVKKAVMAEYRYARARNTTIRSAYVDRLGAIPERREVSLLQELGAVDPRLGVEITPEVLIGLYRAARSPIDLEPTDLDLPPDAARALAVIGGLLTRHDRDQDSPIEEMISSITWGELGSARDVARAGRNRLELLPSASSAGEAPSLHFAMARNALLQREFAVMHLVALLKLIRQNLDVTQLGEKNV